MLVATSRRDGPGLARAPVRRSPSPPGGDRLWHYVAVRGGVVGDAGARARARPTRCRGSARRRSLRATGSASATIPARRSTSTARRCARSPTAPASAPAHASTGSRRMRSSVLVGVAVDGHGGRAASACGSPAPASDAWSTHELPSEGLVRGAIQVPPDGDPVMMLADHPTTGGYPVLAVVHPDDVVVVAQTSAGETRALPGLGSRLRSVSPLGVGNVRPSSLRHLHGAVPSSRGEPDAGDRTRPRS